MYYYKIKGVIPLRAKKQAGAELGQAQLHLELGFTLTRFAALH